MRTSTAIRNAQDSTTRSAFAPTLVPLRRWAPRILGSPAFTSSPSLLVITWDEGVGSNQRVATILAGSAVKRHYISRRADSHYSLLHTIEAEWHLRPFTANDARAATMGEFLRQKSIARRLTLMPVG